MRGQLVIENYIRCEAQQIVDEQFGHIRRLSDMEKVDMHKIVAQRMQHHKEVCMAVLLPRDAMLAPVLPMVPCVCLSICHTPVLCQNDSRPTDPAAFDIHDYRLPILQLQGN